MSSITLPAASRVITKRRRLTASDKIDICRGLFAFLIVIAHGVDISWSLFPSAREGCGWTYAPLAYIVSAGIYWVIGFFVISGYCIQLSVSRLSREKTFPLAKYLLARVTRIFPLYYIGLVVALVVECVIAPARPGCWPNGLNARTLVGQLIFVQNLTQTFGCYAASWSITNELFYYVFYGVLVWGIAGRSIRSTTLGLVICLVIAVPLDVIHMTIFHSRYVYGLGMLFGLGSFWFMGAMVAEHRDWLKKSRLARAVSRSWPLFLILAISLWYSQRVNFQFVLMSLGVAFTLMLARFLASDAEAEASGEHSLTPAWVELFGLSSYPTYLFHAPMMMLAGSVITRFDLTQDWRVVWLVMVIIGIATGITLAYLAERPIMTWRAGYLKRRSQAKAEEMRGGVPVGMAGIP